MTKPLRFGVFFAPYHSTDLNPSLQIRRGISMAQHLDEIGFDEIWYGEHHSQGIEIIGAPDLMLAAIAERTERIRVGMGVASLPWHHPLVFADRMCQLDQQTRGRLIVGTGPGKTAVDSHMMMQDQNEQRRMQDESLSAIVPLFNGEVVDMQTDWFKLQDARLQILPYHGPGTLEVVAASMSTPSGPVLAAKHGASLLSLSAGDAAGFQALDTNWKIYEDESAARGFVADRDKWRVVSSAVFLAETKKEAHELVTRRVTFMGDFLGRALNMDFSWSSSPEATIEQWTTEGVPGFGRAIIGTPDEAIEQIYKIQEKTGGFGTYMINGWDLASFEASKRSYELFASEVMPVFKGSNIGRKASMDFLTAHSKEMAEAMGGAMAKARVEYYKDEAAANSGNNY